MGFFVVGLRERERERGGGHTRKISISIGSIVTETLIHDLRIQERTFSVLSLDTVVNGMV
jgi:hypothetical protein